MGAAIQNQPESLIGFLADIVFLTWGLTAVGEQLFFRGFVLQRLLAIAGDRTAGVLAACLLQAVWFGAGHPSQGLSGMLLAGTLGFVFAWFFVRRSGRSLIPLILAHGAVDTVVLTITYLT